MDIIKIGKFIAGLREDKGYTQIELAKKLNISNKTISKWENGRGIPDPSMLIPLSEILEISVNELLCGERIEKEEFVKKSDNIIIKTLKEAMDNKNKFAKRVVIISLVFIMALGYALSFVPFAGNFAMQYKNACETAQYDMVRAIQMGKVIYSDSFIAKEREEISYGLRALEKYNYKELDLQSKSEHAMLYVYFSCKGTLFTEFINKKDSGEGDLAVIADYLERLSNLMDTGSGFGYSLNQGILGKNFNHDTSKYFEKLSSEEGIALINEILKYTEISRGFNNYYIPQEIWENVPYIGYTTVMAEGEEILYDWGVKMSVGDVSNEGCTVLFEKEKTIDNLDLTTGEAFRLQKYNSDEFSYTNGWWEDVQLLPEVDSMYFFSIAYNISEDKPLTIKTNFENYYGELEQGVYKIEKTVTNKTKDGENQTQKYYGIFKVS